MRRINRCLNHQLIDICKQSMALEKLNAYLQQFLPQSLKGHCFVSSFNKGNLQITTHNAAFASELRFSIPALRDALRKEAHLYQLVSINIHILEIQPIILKTIKPKASLSLAAKGAILNGLDSIEDDKLKEALKKLIR